MVAPTHNMNDGREERVARYKEERRRQLAAQFGGREVRSTRASRLRSQANTQDCLKSNRLPQNSDTSKQDDEEYSGREKGQKGFRRRSLLSRTPSNSENTSPTPGDRRIETGYDEGRKDSKVSSPLPRSALLVKRQIANTNRGGGATPGGGGDSDGGGTGSSRIPRKISSPHLSSPTLRSDTRSSPVGGGGTATTTQVRCQAISTAKTGGGGGGNISKVVLGAADPPTHPIIPPLTLTRRSSSPTPSTGIESSSSSSSVGRVGGKVQGVPHSILKKSSLDESSTPHQPVSILKRKTSTDEGTLGGGRSGSPVRFSPKLVEKTGRGILKKHRSLDDSRHDSTQNGGEEGCRPILKSGGSLTSCGGGGGRCSVEEGMGGILKRGSLGGAEEEGASSPPPSPHHSILKRKSSSPHSAAELAFRQTAEALHDLDQQVRPILKKKEECGGGVERRWSPEPRPILKKKSSSEETEESSPPPPSLTVRPILKTRPSQSDDQTTPSSSPPPPHRSNLKDGGGVRSGSGVVVRRRGGDGERIVGNSESGREGRWSLDCGVVYRRPKSPLALDISSRPRPLSVAERVLHLEHSVGVSTTTNNQPSVGRMERGDEAVTLERSGSVSEKASLWNKPIQVDPTPPRNKGTRMRSKVDASRFCTQPVTQVELEEAIRNNNNSLDCVDEEDPSRLSLSERIKLFSKEKKKTVASSGGGTKEQPSSLPFERPTSAARAPLPRPLSTSIVSGLLKNLSEKSGERKPKKTEEERKEDEEVVEREEKRDTEDEARNPLGRRVSTSDDEESSSSSSSEDEEVRRITTRRPPQHRLSQLSNDEDTSSSGGREIASILSSGQTRGNGVRKGGMVRCGEVSALRRSATQPLTSSVQQRDEPDDGHHPPTTIAQRLAALQKSGHSEWRKRVTKPAPPPLEPTTPNQGGVLADKLVKLETEAREGWKKRVVVQDSEKYTVAGRMSPRPATELPPSLGEKSRTPGQLPFTSSAPIPSALNRSLSLPHSEEEKRKKGVEVEGALVEVPNLYDEEFSSFFSEPTTNNTDLNATLDQDLPLDFEIISQQSSQLLVCRKRVRVSRKHRSANPVKALSQRSDLKTEYTELRHLHPPTPQLHYDKFIRKSGLALEALAGLASKEDLKGVSLRSGVETYRQESHSQWSHPILLRVKGRRHPISSIVKPHFTSLDQGDSFILVTRNKVYNWVGEFCNVIEKSRGSELASEIQTRRDLGCLEASHVTTLRSQDGDIPTERYKEFLKALSWEGGGREEGWCGRAAGHPTEDEVYEVALAQTFLAYTLSGDTLKPLAQAWGKLPSIDSLDPHQVLVFDFDSEVYVWGGKHAELSEKRRATHLARELLRHHRLYTWHNTGIGWLDQEMRTKERPKWSQVYRVSQHMEPVLFREKFTDWPPQLTQKHHKEVDGSIEVEPCDVEEMIEMKLPEPDFILEGAHLGRGQTYYDPETMRRFEVETEGLVVERVEEGRRVELRGEEIGHFVDTESYILSWEYRLSVRGLVGRGPTGRPRAASLVWQGSRAPALGQGAAALLSAADQAGRHLVISEGCEPPALLAALPGPFVLHTTNIDRPISMFIITGEIDPEARIHQIKQVGVDSLRSWCCAWLVDVKSGESQLWFGCATTSRQREVAINALTYLKENTPTHLLPLIKSIVHVYEGQEPSYFFLSGVKESRERYGSALSGRTADGTTGEKEELRRELVMYHLSCSGRGELRPALISSLYFHPLYSTPFNYTQSQLYSHSQPSVMLVDDGRVVWLWEGWLNEEAEGAGSTGLRHYATVRAAKTTALRYSIAKYGGNAARPRHVRAGLEPPHFISLFPYWTRHEEARSVNLRAGYSDCGMDEIGEEGSEEDEDEDSSEDGLKKRGGERERFTAEQLRRQPPPPGVDPVKLELHLHHHLFKEVLGVTEEEFSELPSWKQTKLKKAANLF